MIIHNHGVQLSIQYDNYEEGEIMALAIILL